MAFSTRASLSAAPPLGGKVILAEYLEQYPLLLARPGMGARLVTYYRKASPTDSGFQRLRAEAERGGAKWRVGRVEAMGEDYDSPFLGDVPPGGSQLALESGLFRAAAHPYAPPPSDFLLIRRPVGTMALREVTGMVAVGQELPMHRIPTPNSRDLK